MADFMDKVANNFEKTEKKNKEEIQEPEDLGRLHSVQVRQFYYKKLKIKAAMEDQSMVDLVQRAIKHALEDGTI